MARSAKAGGKRSAAKARKARSKGSNRKARPKKTPAAKPASTVLGQRQTIVTARDEVSAREHALADILSAINSSAGELQPVLRAVLEHAVNLCEANFGILLTYDGAKFMVGGLHGLPPAYEEFMRGDPPQPGPRSAIGRILSGERVVQIEDVTTEKAFQFGDPRRRALAELGRARSYVAVGLFKDTRLLGTLAAYRQEVRPFPESKIALLQTFAAHAVIAIENARLFNEVQAKTRDLEEALRYQTGSANILNVIASSPTDVKPVLQAIVESACELCGAYDALVRLKVGDGLAFGAHHGPLPVSLETLPFSPNSTAGLAMIKKRAIHVHDIRSPDGDKFPYAQNLARVHGERTILSVPLLREGESIGALVLRRLEVSPFSDKQIALLETFANQAVIAIENARLFNETKEALARQTATADVLKVIASSPSNLQPVFDAIAERSNELMRGHATTVFRFAGDTAELASFTPVSEQADAVLRAAFPRPISSLRDFGAISRGEVAETIDAQAYTEPETGRNIARARGFRSRLVVPLNSDSDVIGAISITRKEAGAFADKDKELLQTFADQAVIAIQNVELFEEVQARTRDLQESLQQQTATADVLKVISRSAFDLKGVLDTLVESATHLCEADHAWLFQRDGQLLRFKSSFGHGTATHERIRELFLRRDVHIERGSITGRSALEGCVVHVADVLKDPEYTWTEAQAIGGYRAALGVPLLRDGEVVGVIFVAKLKPEAFSQQQIDLVTMFADQAVIAIENARLFNEVQAKTHDLEEALRYQTGSANILNVIASSPTDVQPVLKAIVESACELCGAYDAVVHLREGDALRAVAHHGPIPLGMESRPLSRSFASGRAATDKVTIHIRDVLSAEGDELPEAQEMSRRSGIRTLLCVPLLRESESIGTILLRRTEVAPFSAKQVGLLRTFADQAVIAIENARLFNETEEALERQTATADILKVIASSPSDVRPVFNAIASSALRLFDGYTVWVVVVDGDQMVLKAVAGLDESTSEAMLSVFPRRIDRETGTGRVITEQSIVHVADTEAVDVPQRTKAVNRAMNVRALIGAPMQRAGGVIGAIMVSRQKPGAFSEKQIAMLQSLSDQAVIAINNVEMFEKIQQRSLELSSSLEDLRAAQDRLIQTEKLASLGQLTAGIAHEIKNPLNFVNNFSQLSTELIDEMSEVFENPALDEAERRKELDEIRQLLKGNLEKVVQHGKRADSIVKNMLLHSREGSGELRAADINGLVEESLNLAYHGARAEKSGFNITLQREFDATAGSAELYPQEITRALLNLISNGFYAATKGRTENGEAGHEPTLSASTKNLGASVEIRIRDNGPGIPAEVKEKIFNPFFTTKPAGEGTGLGLSMTHDIIVKQHGGTISVDTQPGEYTEFIVTLPRATSAQANQRSTT